MNAHREPVADASWEASVSAWVDGEAELRAEELDTPYGRQVWDTYHLIGDVMRSQDLAIQPSERFYARLTTALDAEPAIVAPLALARHPAWRLGLSGLAVAAAVASVVWMVQPLMSGTPTQPAAAPVMAQADDTEAPDPTLADYMSAHQDMAGAGPVRQVSYDSMGSR